MTQTEELYEYLQNHDSITPLEALRELGIMRLSARIKNLKEQGILINSKIVGVKARNGRTAYVASYSLAKETKE